jgi:hypothetical protein
MADEALPDLPPGSHFGSSQFFSASEMLAYALQAVQAERARAEQDAARYRWLKRGGNTAVLYHPTTLKLPSSWDASIDAAIRAEASKTPTAP